ncbi:ATP-dependent DNA ligase [Paenibacillus piri]|nr:ATP-dependent DNA ligase [Paenibacillus piri]
MFIAPMLLDSKDEPFSDPAFVFEPKLDGHRIILSVIAKETRLFTHGRQDCTKQYPELLQVPLQDDVVLDGEVCCMNPDTGSMDYELVMERLRLTQKTKIRSYASQRPVHVAVWDILYYKGRDLRNLPLVKRRSILESLLVPNDRFRLVPQVENNGEELFRTAVEQSLEGIVAKRKDSLYVSRSSHDWISVLNRRYTEVELAGYCKHEFGWLLQTKVDGVMRPAGMLKQQVSPKQERILLSKSKKKIWFESDRFVYLKPGIKANVMYRGFTRHGMLREPALVNIM